MIEKKLIGCLAATAAAALALGLTACSGGEEVTGVRKEFTGEMYAQTAPAWQEQALVAEGYTFSGEGVTLDGKLDEAAWQTTYPFVYGSIGVTVSVYVVFGEDGFYVGYDIDDTEAYFHGERSSENNSSVEIYFSPVGTTSLDATVLQVRLEPDGDSSCYRALGSGVAQLSYPWSQGYIPVYGLSFAKNGWTENVDTGGMETDGGLQYEMFIGWEALSLDSAPEQVKLYPCYNYMNSSSADAKRVSQVWPQGRYNEPMDYFVFDEKGYVNNDARLAEEYGDMLFGDAPNGLGKSTGWDLTSWVEDGVIKATASARASQYLYVKDADPEAYLFKVKAQFIAGVEDNDPRMGVVIGRNNSSKSDLNMYTETFQVGVANGHVGQYQFTHKVGDDAGGKFVSWVSSDLASYSAPNDANGVDAPVEIAVVKQGGMFFFFLNGTYISSATYSRFAEGGALGLYVVGAQATYSDISYTTDEDTIETYLEGSNIHLVNIVTNAGGTFSGTVGGNAIEGAQGAAFTGTADIELTIMPTMDVARTYRIASVKVDGEEVTLTGNKLLIEDRATSVTIEIEFAVVTGGAQIAFAGGAAQVTIAAVDGIDSYTLNVEDGLRVRLADGTWNITVDGGGTFKIVIENGEVTEGSATIDVGTQQEP